MSDNIYDELQWRGLIYQESGQGEVKQLLEKNITLYAGFDPTSDSLHIGSLIPLITLRRFQLYGHKVLPLAGGATGLIGDPSGKSNERQLLTKELVDKNLQGIATQLEKLIDFSSSQAEIVNNYDWTCNLSIIEFLRDIGKYFSVNKMMDKDSVATRLNDDSCGISFTEFSYMTLQAYDFLHLYKEHDCVLQIGGSDQWGNMTAGMELIRRSQGKSAHCLTLPLITTSDGKKFGKTEKGAIWLDLKRTCSYDFYQYWYNTNDDDVIRFLKYFTFLSQKEILSLEESLKLEPHLRLAQKKLASEMTTQVHSEEETLKAINTSQALFGQGDISSIDEVTLEAIHHNLSSYTYEDNKDIQGALDMVVKAKLASSNNQARDMIKSSSISFNDVKIDDFSFVPAKEDLLFGKYAIIRRGRKKFALLKIIIKND